MTDLDPFSDLEALRGENARLIALLESHGIECRIPPQVIAAEVLDQSPSRFSTTQKVKLFRQLFRGRTDVYPVRWESKSSGKAGYSPACANEWRAGVCEKPRIKCGDCRNRLLIELTDAVVYDHLAGEHTIGEMMRKLSCSLATNWGFQQRSRFPVPGMARTHGFSSPVALQPAIPGVWVRPSSAIPAREPGN